MPYPYPIADLPRERRDAADRRNFTLHTLWHGMRRQRRRRSRRDGEAAVLDVHPPRYRYWILGLLGLSCLDAIFTLQLLQRGATEVNPFMALLIGIDLRLFAFIKTLVTGICAGLLVILAPQHVFRIRGDVLLRLAVLAYLVLINWELALLGGFAGSA
ncbi:MAG: DUF5658 family protein [Thiohalobacteraceae bacterium]|nr:DUF5658 family protein [Gammaproteobacteria bacterium]